MFDGKAFGEQIVEMVRDYVDRTIAPLKAENDALRASVAAMEARDVGMGQQAVEAMVAASVAAAFEDRLPAVIEDARGLVDGAVADAVAAIPPAEPGVDGTSVDPEQVRAWIAEKVAAIPPAPAGESVTIADVAPLIREAVSEEVSRLPVPKDGVGLAGALIDRTGALILTLTDGRTVELGRVEGEPGKDGLGFDDLEVGYDGERGITLDFVQGDRTKSFSLSMPVVIDRGVFKDGAEYVTGDAVSFGGSLWIAQRATTARPDGPDTGWRLAVKKGRDATKG